MYCLDIDGLSFDDSSTSCPLLYCVARPFTHHRILTKRRIIDKSTMGYSYDSLYSIGWQNSYGLFHHLEVAQEYITVYVQASYQHWLVMCHPSCSLPHLLSTCVTRSYNLKCMSVICTGVVWHKESLEFKWAAVRTVNIKPTIVVFDVGVGGWMEFLSILSIARISNCKLSNLSNHYCSLIFTSFVAQRHPRWWDEICPCYPKHNRVVVLNRQ